MKNSVIRYFIENEISFKFFDINGFNDIYVNNENVGYLDLGETEKDYPYVYQSALGKSISVTEVLINEDQRKKGYLKATILYLIGEAKDKGYNSIFLRVADDSDIPQEVLESIYLKLGFDYYNVEDEDEDDTYMVYWLC